MIKQWNQGLTGGIGPEIIEQKGQGKNQKKARTTHHSRQISWNRDVNQDLTNPAGAIVATHDE